MREIRRVLVKWRLVLLLVVSLAGSGGCSSLPDKSAAAKQTPPKPKTGEVKGTATLSYDFEDILIPAALSLDRNKSFVYSTPAFAAGVLVFSGYVDGESLVSFFTKHMPENGWMLRSSFRYQKTILNFEKGERSCLIIIAESRLATQVEVWVAPQAVAR